MEGGNLASLDQDGDFPFTSDDLHGGESSITTRDLLDFKSVPYTPAENFFAHSPPPFSLAAVPRRSSH